MQKVKRKINKDTQIRGEEIKLLFSDNLDIITNIRMPVVLHPRVSILAVSIDLPVKKTRARIIARI